MSHQFNNDGPEAELIELNAGLNDGPEAELIELNTGLNDGPEADLMELNAGLNDPELGSQSTAIVDQDDATADDDRRNYLKEAKIKATQSRVKKLFPGLATDWIMPKDIKKIKYELNHRVNQIIRNMDPETRERLNMRDNAAEFCTALGLNDNVVSIKFQAHAAFEEETGIQIKTPVLCMVQHLIENIDYDSPFGEVNNDTGIASNYKGGKWLEYLGVPLSRGEVGNTIKNVEELVPIKKDHFLHGTSSTALQGIFDELGFVEPSHGKHDFGTGVYCMMGGHLNRALGWGIALTWPEFDEFTDARGKQDFKILDKNPAVILFRNEEGFRLESLGDETEVFHVGQDRYPLSKQYIMDKLLPERYHQGYIDQRLWDKSNKKWEHFVKIARLGRYVPKKYSVFYGWLHECDSVEQTDNGAEPKRDPDDWEQICFQDIREQLGIKKLFIEFHFDWESWGQAVETESHFKSRKKEADDICTSHETI